MSCFSMCRLSVRRPTGRQRFVSSIFITSQKRKTPLTLYFSQRSYNKKRPWQKYTICQGRIIQSLSAVPPWFTAIFVKSHVRFSRIPTYPRQMTSAYNVAEYSEKLVSRGNAFTFDCALSGPFDNLFLAWFSASQALYKGIIAVISASTVWSIKFIMYCIPCCPPCQ